MIAGNGDGGACELRRLDSLPSARALWEELEAHTGNPFSTYAFAETWWRHFGDGRPLRLSAVSDPVGASVALLPFFEAENGARPTLRIIGHRAADLLGPICAPADRHAAVDALGSALGSGPGRMILDDVAVGTAAQLGAVVERITPSPVLELPAGGWHGVLRTLSANHRASVRAKERRLMRAARVEIRESDGASLERDFATLLRLHRRRWRGRSRIYDGIREDFHRAFATVAQRRGWLRLRVLELDGVPVAANYALRYGDDEWFWQSGRDPSLERASVGAVLTAHCIRSCAEDGIRAYRWLRGDEAYKLRWATGDEPVETATLERS